MPMSISDITKFEKKNNVAINVFATTTDGSTIWVRRITSKREQDPINLLMLDDGNNYHYTLITSLNRLLCSPKESNTKQFCPYCLHGFVYRYKMMKTKSMNTNQTASHMIGLKWKCLKLEITF